MWNCDSAGPMAATLLLFFGGGVLEVRRRNSYVHED